MEIAVTVVISVLLQLPIYGGRKMDSIFGTIVVVGILILGISLAIFSMIRDKKNGKSIQCGCDCRKCGGHCHNGDLK